MIKTTNLQKKTTNLQKVFRTDEVETWALNNVSIEVKEGEFVAIMGPSGCGNVYENIELPLLYMGVPAAERRRRVEEAMDRMAIAHRSKHFPQQLSGGQQQRVAIARAVVAGPRLILADEPTGNLDSKNGKEVMALLTELNREGTTVVMVTHSQHDAGYAGRIINLFDGQVVTEVAM